MSILLGKVKHLGLRSRERYQTYYSSWKLPVTAISFSNNLLISENATIAFLNDEFTEEETSY